MRPCIHALQESCLRPVSVHYTPHLNSQTGNPTEINLAKVHFETVMAYVGWGRQCRHGLSLDVKIMMPGRANNKLGDKMMSDG